MPNSRTFETYFSLVHENPCLVFSNLFVSFNKLSRKTNLCHNDMEQKWVGRINLYVTFCIWSENTMVILTPSGSRASHPFHSHRSDGSGTQHLKTETRMQEQNYFFYFSAWWGFLQSKELKAASPKPWNNMDDADKPLIERKSKPVS